MTATDFKDYYAILGVSKSATPEEIKKAFRKLARQYHPDVNPGDKAAENRFKEINEAHEVLSDPEKRQKYDQFGQYWKQAGAGGPAPGTGGVDFDQYGNFDDFINELLGRFGRQSQAGGRTYTYSTGPEGYGGFNFEEYGDLPGQDAEAAIALTFSEAFHGTQKRFQLGNETVTVRIPPGAKSGSRIRVKGKGQVSPFSHQRGDLYLTIELLPHSFFRFEQGKLVCDVPLSPAEAALGTQIQVPTPDGPVTMTVPAGIDSGQTLRLRGKGWRDPNNSRGDQLVRLKIVTPNDLSAEERQHYQALQQLSHFKPRKRLQEVRL